ncbi:hypothetical protein TWF569_000479 [Orbilia oligospora]|nr:hypothetical protein TWF569_000479 [Orbilia oligospora]
MAAQNPTDATPTSFYTLPNEILVQIFIDEVSQPTWKLIRHLINNPELNSGHQIVSITVEWHRRVAKSEDTWTKPWFWTTAEQSKLEPPSATNRRIVDDTGAKCTQSLEALRSHWDRSPERVYRDEREALEADETLFFFDYLKRSDSLPGLRGLKYFSAKYQDGIGSRCSETILPPIFGLPGIESIQVSFTTNGEHKDGYSPKYNFDAKSTSSVKYLELSVSGTGGHSEECFFSLAKLTGNLSRVNIRRKYKSGEITRTLEGDEEIARTFLQYNKAALQSSKIFINSGGFNNDGEYDGDAERRKMVLEEQRLFELNRCHGPSSRPPSPFIALKPLLLSHIIPHLTRTDVFNLMLSCKAFKDICQRNLWSIFLFRETKDIKNHPLKERFLNVNNWVQLEKRMEKYGIEEIKNLERLDVGDEVFFPSDGGIYDTTVNKKQVFTIFSDHLRNGSTPNLKLASIQLGCYGRQRSSSPPFFHMSSFHSMFGGPAFSSGFSSRPPSRSLSENTSEITISEDAYDRYSRSHPPGFINLIINTNPGLSPRCLQAIADKKADRCNYNISWRIRNIIELCSGELEGMLKTTVAGYAKKLIGERMVEKKGVLKEGFDEEVNYKVTGLVAEEFEKVMVGIFAEKCKEIVRGGLLQWSD